MSSSKPYQSRVLTFLLRQFHTGVARQQQLWRQVKSAATWGVQTALYPVYLLLRTARSASPQLQGTAQSWWRRLRPVASPSPTPDLAAAEVACPALQANAAIVQVLTVARQGQIPAARGRLVRLLQRRPQPLAVRGIAVDLETRSLQLIDRSNQLCPPVNGHLQQQIEALIVAYWQRLTAQPVLAADGSAAAVLPSPGTFPTLRQTGADRAGTPLISAPIKAPVLPESAWDAVVAKSSYVMHPLERVLRWLDQVLSWIERQWLSLSRRWAGRAKSTGPNAN